MADIAANISGLNRTMNASQSLEIPQNLLFTEDSLVSIIAYGVVFCIAACGNLTVFITLFRNRRRKSRVNLFIMHLSVADMIVTFIMIPLEIGWHVTVSWQAGDVGCRVFMFMRTFGFYLSSFILVAISIDRYFAITHPLSISNADRRGRLLLIMAWLFSTVSSIPQSVIFHVEVHPSFAWFKQCVTFNFFPTSRHELAYNLFNMAALYWLPLLVIIVSYSLILWEIFKRTKEGKEQSKSFKDQKLRRKETLRRSGIGRIEKARSRTLKLTIVIVLAFVMCWTPYFVINAWFWIDKDSASKIDIKVTRGLLIFAVSNSCVNPIVYGMFSNTFAREWRKCCNCRIITTHTSTTSNTATTRSINQMEMSAIKALKNQAALSETSSYKKSSLSGALPEPVTKQIQVLSNSHSAKCPLIHQVTPTHIPEGKGQRNNFVGKIFCYD